MQVLDSGNEFVDCACDVFMRGEVWENMLMEEETNGFALANTACVGSPDVEAEVVFWGASNIPAL